MGTRLAGCIFVTMALLSGCGDDSSPPRDAGSDGGVDAAMCVAEGAACSFATCCGGYCCCVPRPDAGTCALTCVATRTGTCR